MHLNYTAYLGIFCTLGHFLPKAVFTLAKVRAIMTCDMLVLALATLGGAKEIASFLCIVVPPKVAKTSTVVTVTWLSCVAVADGFDNKLRQCKQPIMDHLHCQHLLAIMPPLAPSVFTCLGHLGWRDTDRIISIYVMPPKVAKANTVVTVTWLSCVAVADGFANKLCQCKQSIMDHLHCQHLLVLMLVPATSVFTCLGHLW